MSLNRDIARPCQSCQLRHAKCEWSYDAGTAEDSPKTDTQLICVRCAESGTQCIRSPLIRFKNSNDLPFSQRQQWVRCPKRIYFVHETEEIHALYNCDEFDAVPHRSSSWQSTCPLAAEQHVRPFNEQQQYTNLATNTDGTSPIAIPLEKRDFCRVPLDSVISLARAPPKPNTAFAFPLLQFQEITLMKYYLEYMCHWFDLCDQKRHFAVELPRRAVTSPILLNAIFALSARHLSFTSQFDSYAADRYHKRCLQQLGNIPHDSSALLDDDLLSATILLRTLEEIDVKLLGIDHEGHLLGIQAFLNTPGPPNQPTSPLRQASFWIGLRQEIVVAFANQRSINLSLDLDFIDQSLNDADDDTWANRIIVNCAHVVQYCFGGEEHSSKRFEELKSYDEQWLRARPSSFLPLAYTEPNREAGEVFPTILYLNHAVVIGLVHSIFARILLLCYNPLLPKIGAGHRLVQTRTQEAIRQQVRELCGTALSNPATIPAMFTASMGVAAAGDRFDDYAERLALLEVLNKTETEHAWPTAASQRNLRESWQWVDDQECSW